MVKLDANLTGGELFHLIHELDYSAGYYMGDIEAVFAQIQAHHDTPDSRDVLQPCYYVLKKWRVRFLPEMGTAYRLHQWGIQIHGEHGVIEVNFFTSSVTFNYLDGK